MATQFSEILDVVNTLKSAEVAFSDTVIPLKYVKWGIVNASIALGTDYNTTMLYDDNGEIVGGELDIDLADKQILLCGLYAFRGYAVQEHHKMANKAVNFKTVNFAVTGLTERAKEVLYIVKWCDNEIKNILGMMELPMGSADEMCY